MVSLESPWAFRCTTCSELVVVSCCSLVLVHLFVVSLVIVSVVVSLVIVSVVVSLVVVVSLLVVDCCCHVF